MVVVNVSMFTMYGSGKCEYAYIGPSGYPLNVEIPHLCDEILSGKKCDLPKR